MRRAVLPLAILLSAVTALTFVGAAVSLRPVGVPIETEGSDDAARRALTYAFYDAANAAIATGSLDRLAGIVAPDLLANAADPDAAPFGLARRLLALHATAPALTLSVVALAIDGDLAIVQVAVAGAAAAPFLGIELRDRPLPWSPVDVLRLADDRVVAHNDTATRPGWLETPLATPLHLLTDTPRRLTIARLTLAAGADHAAGAVAGGRLLVVERGELAVRVTSLAMGMTSDASLRAGDELFLRSDVTPPRSSAYQARNAGAAPAVLLDITLTAIESPTAPARPRTSQGSSGVSAEILIPGLDLAGPTGPAVLTLGRAILVPGDRLAWAGSPGTTLLFVDVDAAPAGRPTGGVEVRQRTGGRTTDGDTVLVGNLLLVPVATHAEIRVLADRPVSLLVATLLPFEPEATASPGADRRRRLLDATGCHKRHPDQLHSMTPARAWAGVDNRPGA